MSEQIYKLEPRRTLYLRGFDRRGCAASLNNASASGFTVSGVFSDQADFAVVVLFDADDQFGHLFTTKYLPDFSLAGVTLDFDLAITSAQNPVSRKFQSVPWGALSYITKSETPGTISLLPMATSATGMAAASQTFTVNGTPAVYDRVQLVYLSNLVYDYLVSTALSSGPSTVTFGFFNYLGTGYDHTIIIGSNTYSHVQLSTDGSGDIAIALAAAINAANDPNATASVSANDVILTARLNSGASISCSASDGNGPGTLIESQGACPFVAAQLPSQINGTNWASINPTIALMATVSGASFTVYAARYGTVNTSGTSVSFASGQNFLGSQAGDPVLINGVQYAIASVNSPASASLTTSAGTQTGVNYLAPGGGRDGNSIELLEMHKTSTAYLTPAGASKLTGGADLSSVHFHIDFTANGIDSLRQAWLTFAPALNYDSGSVNPALVAYQPSTWSAVFTNWTLSDPSGVLPLKIAGPGSVAVGSRDFWASFTGTGWSEQVGFYFRGFALQSSNPTDHVTITYSCQYTHNLYLGTSLSSASGQLTATLDGVAQPTIDTFADTTSPISARRLIASSVVPGTHVVVLTVSSAHNSLSTGASCCFDYLQPAVLSDVQSPATTYPNVNCACDFDTAQTYAIAPARAFWILSKAGFAGDIDFYSGVFFALKRVRSGGSFHQPVVTISAGSSGFNLGSLYGDGDAMFLQVGGASYGDGVGTAFGAAVYPTDTVDTLAQRFVNAINSLFVGISAAKTGTGQLTITTLSPVAGFTVFKSYAAGTGANGANPSTGSIAISGDIEAGNEGVWRVDASQSQPLNRAFVDYLTDFCALVKAAGQTMTVAFSQELLAPPDANTAAGAWAQRFANGSQVLTDTGTECRSISRNSMPDGLTNAIAESKMIRRPIWIMLMNSALNRIFLALTLGGSIAWAQFAPSSKSPFASGNNPTAIVVADFNNDMIPDLAVANQTDNTIQVLFGDGTGNFFAPATGTALNGTFPTGADPSAMAAGDFNKDGNMDLAVANINGNSVTILLGNGAGGFSAAPQSPGTGNGPVAIAAQDFDGDGFLDLAVANLDDGTVMILFGSGTGSFAPRSTVPVLQAGSHPIAIVAADLNADGHPDIAVASEDGAVVNVFLDPAQNPAQPPQMLLNSVVPVTPPIQQSFSGIAAGNFTGHAMPFLDLAVTYYSNSTFQGNVLMFTSDETGHYQTPTASVFSVSIGSEPLAIGAGFFDVSGFPELAILDYRGNNVGVYANNGTGTFTAFAGSPYPTGSLPRALAVADLNGDGLSDLAIANYHDGTVTVLLNTFSAPPTMVSSASGLAPVSAGSLVSIYGTGLCKTTGQTFESTVTLTDSSGVVWPVSINSCSATLINGQLSPMTATGAASFKVVPMQGTLQKGSVMVTNYTPGLFTANMSGKGPAAGYVQQLVAGGAQTPLAQCSSPTVCSPVPFSVSGGTASLLLFGTGIGNQFSISNVTATVGNTPLTPIYAGPVPGTSGGLDQVNIPLPASLAHAGTVFVQIAIGNQMSNMVTIAIE